MKRFRLAIGVLVAAFALGLGYIYSASFAPSTASRAQATSNAVAAGGHAEGEKEESGHEHKEGEEDKEGKIGMTAERIAAAKIAVAKAEPGNLRRRLSVPGAVTMDRNRIGRVAAKVIGTVAELKKRLGDGVRAGETIAILDSREVADAKSEYIAAVVNFQLQNTLYERGKALWEKKISSEQQYLRARATQQEAQVRRDLARQKLSALGVGDKEVDGLSATEQVATGLERYEIRAPISGRVTEQLVDLGAPVGGEGQAKELYVIADLSSVWVELTVSTSDLPQTREGQHVEIYASGNDRRSAGRIVFTSPVLNSETRSARVIASVPNADHFWRPGSFVTADVVLEETPAKVVVPKSALQTIKGEPSIFVRTADGFETRQVMVGNDDSQSVEVTFGLEPGETIAVSNTFLLKAEAGKSEAGHAH
ncbi:efflux RND transporter periplasmic adaptor subunit [Hyphomicrobium sp. CS1BSMeth3]|uniref:efflux RND transporter periplasmic adaptor subunit n=1 Tax=Hyphomicrobium sp. CS1BSMeth3 TaxID=1892844 RepID=UPI0009308991|nr:efflux RND transporter periplasmic adaptor subunit [Hyphomicrobium sp. CS1BSMeth3]